MSGISDELRDKIRLAISDPGHFLQRGDESVPAWATRAVVSLLDEAGVSVDVSPEPACDADIMATEYDVSILPRDDINRPHWTITVAYRGRDRYAVLNGGYCLSRAGFWDYEMRPSDRDDDWIAQHRFTRDEALQLAAEHAPNVVCNGKTAVELLEWLREREAPEVAGGGAR